MPVTKGPRVGCMSDVFLDLLTSSPPYLWLFHEQGSPIPLICLPLSVLGNLPAYRPVLDRIRITCLDLVNELWGRKDVTEMR